MMMKIKLMVAALAMMMTATTMSAQDKKLFTLEDLNFGGNNYANLRPQNMWLTWWGEQLIQQDVEACYTINTKTGKKTLLFTLDDINKWAGSDDTKYVRHLMNATFPYPNKPIVKLGNRKAVILLDFKAKQVIWQDSIAGQQAYDWNATSRATCPSSLRSFSSFPCSKIQAISHELPFLWTNFCARSACRAGASFRFWWVSAALFPQSCRHALFLANATEK